MVAVDLAHRGSCGSDQFCPFEIINVFNKFDCIFLTFSLFFSIDKAGINVGLKNKEGLTALDIVTQFTASRAGLEIKQMLRGLLYIQKRQFVEIFEIQLYKDFEMNPWKQDKDISFRRLLWMTLRLFLLFCTLQLSQRRVFLRYECLYDVDVFETSIIRHRCL